MHAGGWGHVGHATHEKTGILIMHFVQKPSIPRENEPDGHAIGLSAGLQQYLLAGHHEHCVEPSLSAYCPGMQLLHSVEPFNSATVPLAHWVCLIAGLQQYEPEGHSRQTDEPSFSA